MQDLDETGEGPLPIDDSDGGCNCEPRCKDINKRVWTHQIDALSIGPDDAVTDSGQEVYNLLKQQGRENVIVMGVHGRNPVDLMLFGSTTNHVVRAAGCPVLTLRG